MEMSTNRLVRISSWIIFIFYCLHVTVQAGPVHITNSRRLIREIYPAIEPENDSNQPQVCIVGDVVYAIDEIVTAEQPCLKCRCQPPGVLCETVKCAKKPGCKTIHRPNKCCPDYQCECHHEGRTYSNGERLKAPPGGECRVCYCRGGELQCADVSCYLRADCPGKTVPGQCCPKYDHCPPRDLIATGHNTTTLNALEPWPTEGATEPARKRLAPPTITIQEIIPAVREIPITQSTLELDPNTNDLLVVEPETDSSEISEVFQHPPPVLRIGDKLLFLKQGDLVPDNGASTPSSIITIIGAEGLERGFEDSSEHDTVKSDGLFSNSNDLELKTEESSHILSLVKRKPKPESTTIESSTDTSTETSNLTETSPESSSVTETSSESGSVDETSTESSNKTETSSESGSVDETSTESSNKTEISTESSFSIIGTEPDTKKSTKVANVSTEAPELKILPEILEIRGNSTTLNSTNEEWLKSKLTNSTLINLAAVLPDEILKAKALSDDDSSTSLPDELFNLTSVESLETTESGETVTTKSTEPQLSYDNDASVENGTTPSEIADMVEPTPTSVKLDPDIELLNNETVIESVKPPKVELVTNPMKKEVELISTTKSGRVEEVGSGTKRVEKRSSGSGQEDDVFGQLNAELEGEGESYQAEEEEEGESERIFKELLEETSTPKASRKLSKDEETLQRVSDAIAKLTLKGKQGGFDASILSVISDFFGNQYKQ